MKKSVAVACAFLALSGCQTTSTPAGALGVAEANKLPLADAHFHIMSFMKPDELVERMDRYNIRWAGAAGPAGMIGDDGAFVAKLKNRYIRFAGQFEILQAGMQEGDAAFTNPHSAAFKYVAAEIEDMLADGRAVGIGEIHVNSRTSAAYAPVRRKVPTDSPGMKTLWALAAKYKVPLAIHMQFDPDSVEQLEALVATSPETQMILVHCGKDTDADQVRPIFERHPNVVCDLSYRSRPQEKGGWPNRIIYDGSGIQSDWRKLIEDYPDRFVAGIDDVHSWSEYDAVHENIREGLLAHLTPETAEKVAYKNAVKWFNLK